MSKKNVNSENPSPRQRKADIKTAPEKTVRKVPEKAARKRITEKKSGKWAFSLNKNNMVIALIGLGVILLGYGLMYTGITDEPAIPDGKWNNIFAVDIAPILLVIGYCVILPYALIKKTDNNTDENA